MFDFKRGLLSVYDNNWEMFVIVLCILATFTQCENLVWVYLQNFLQCIKMTAVTAEYILRLFAGYCDSFLTFFLGVYYNHD